MSPSVRIFDAAQLPKNLPAGLLDQTDWVRGAVVDPRTGQTFMGMPHFDNHHTPLVLESTSVNPENRQRALRTFFLAMLDAQRIFQGHNLYDDWQSYDNRLRPLPNGSGWIGPVSRMYKNWEQGVAGPFHFSDGMSVPGIGHGIYWFGSGTVWQALSFSSDPGYLHRTLRYAASPVSRFMLTWPLAESHDRKRHPRLELNHRDLFEQPWFRSEQEKPGVKLTTDSYSVIYRESKEEATDELAIGIRLFFNLDHNASFAELAGAMASLGHFSNLYQAVGKVCTPFVRFIGIDADDFALEENTTEQKLILERHPLVGHKSVRPSGHADFRSYTIYFGPSGISGNQELHTLGRVAVNPAKNGYIGGDRAEIKLTLDADWILLDNRTPFAAQPLMPLPESLAAYWDWSLDALQRFETK